MTIAPSGISVVEAGEADQNAWDAYVSRHVEAVGYHEWCWREIFQRTFDHTCKYLMARNGDGVSGVLPLVDTRSFLFGRSLVSLPFVNFGGVLADDHETANALIDAAAAVARSNRCKHVELRHIGRKFLSLPVKTHKVTMRLGLRQGLWDSLDRKVRNQVRKAQKSDLTVDRGGADLVDDFYSVFSRNMRDLGTPVYSRRLFEQVTQAFPERVRLIIVRLKAQPIAAGLTYRTRDMVEIPWASSIRDFNNLCPNHLLYWHALETALEEGAAVFDFGRSTPGEGTFKFKEQWGALPVELNWEYWLPSGHDLPDQSPKNPKFRLAIEAWKRLPLWAANLIGPRVVRGIP